MVPSDIRFWFGYFYIGPPDRAGGGRSLGLGPRPDDASNGDHRCEVIPFPGAGQVTPPPNKVPRPAWDRVRKNAEMIWSHPKTQGAFVVQRLVAITLAVTLASLFERICE
ncbi:MAG: hypothetical protein RIE87_11785 [Rhodospirillales bacterium]|tara:strand:+ start:838 stop:1167 length:330 start_codon:yes stop_codon:yes gene_type:complete